jgi:thiol-disulfide isomerase/thioredoxin
MPILREVHEEMQGENVKIIGINLLFNDKMEDVLGLLEEHDITHTTLLDEGVATMAYGIRSIPTVVIIDKDGVVTQHKIGPMTHEELVEALKASQ